MADPLSVLMVLEGHFPSVGGAERQLEALSAGLIARGHQVRVLLPRLSTRHPAGAGEVGGIPVWRIDYPRWPLLGSLLLMLRCAFLLVAWRHRYDAIHVHIAHNMGAVAALVGRMLGKPVVVKFSGYWEFEHGSLRGGFRPESWLARLLLRRAFAFQAISGRLAEQLRARGFPARRIHALPNGVATARFACLPRPRSAGGPPTAVFVGRLEPVKSLDDLLRAWQQAGMSDRGWKLKLVGDGSQRQALAGLAQTLGIAAAVELAGATDDVPAQLADADLGVLVSRTEGLSNTLLEYMAAGLPVLATRISGSEDFVRSGRNGWLCEPGDVAAIAAALGACAEMDPAGRTALGLQARADLMHKASMDGVLDRLEALYRGSPPQQAG